MGRLTQADYAIPATQLAPALLGSVLVRVLGDGARLAGTIVETEAYMGPEDAAAHSFGGRRTARTEPMFGEPGTSYVYFTYGMHHCMNVVAAEAGVPQAVLIRALAPSEGLETMRGYRASKRSSKRSGAVGDGRGKPIRDRDLCSGPAKLCQALQIDRGLNAEDLCVSRRVWIEAGNSPERVACGPRVGVDYAGDWAGRPWRWWVEGDPNVSVRRNPSVGKAGGRKPGKMG